MDNKIDARIKFSFRGETHNPSANIDLDALMSGSETHQSLHLLLARTNSIDTYSYLYEVMESCPIEFSNPTGFAADYLSGTAFDFSGFETRWHEQHDLSILNAIIEHHFKGDDCAKHPALKAALTEAFHAGRSAAD
ncbi:MAG: hypothetical protein ABFS39_05660 [Pseudomonadota bacterium]